MSLQPQPIYCVPEETARVARAIFPAGNLVMRMYRSLPIDRQNGEPDRTTLREEASHRILDPGPISNPTHAPLLSQECGGF
jgi:hypothetical protein